MHDDEFSVSVEEAHTRLTRHSIQRQKRCVVGLFPPACVCTMDTASTHNVPGSCKALYVHSMSCRRLLVLLVVVDLVVPEEGLDMISPPISKDVECKRTLSPSPQKKFLVRMFWYEYSGLSSRGMS